MNSESGAALRALGFWATRDDMTLPDPHRLIDETWPEGEREWVADYLEHGQTVRQFMGPSHCRICNIVNGNADLSDGYYLWPEGLAHYVVNHAVRLPAEFLEHINRRLEAFDELEVDSTWWQNNAERT